MYRIIILNFCTVKYDIFQLAIFYVYLLIYWLKLYLQSLVECVYIMWPFLCPYGLKTFYWIIEK